MSVEERINRISDTKKGRRFIQYHSKRGRDSYHIAERWDALEVANSLGKNRLPKDWKPEGGGIDVPPMEKQTGRDGGQVGIPASDGGGVHSGTVGNDGGNDGGGGGGEREKEAQNVPVPVPKEPRLVPLETPRDFVYRPADREEEEGSVVPDGEEEEGSVVPDGEEEEGSVVPDGEEEGKRPYFVPETEEDMQGITILPFSNKELWKKAPDFPVLVVMLRGWFGRKGMDIAPHQAEAVAVSVAPLLHHYAGRFSFRDNPIVDMILVALAYRQAFNFGVVVEDSPEEAEEIAAMWEDWQEELGG